LPLAVEIIGAPAGKEPKAVARRGTAFHYRIALRNTSRRPFRFESCPTYEELWVDGNLGPKETFVLNCRPVGTLRPQEHAVFEMVLEVPREARLGPHGFTWMLAPETYEPPWAPGSVLVTR